MLNWIDANKIASPNISNTGFISVFISAPKCILFSTHDIDLAIQLSDEMIVMTEENLVQDQPCNLITKGVFNTLFKDDSITFDGEKGKFIIN